MLRYFNRTSALFYLKCCFIASAFNVIVIYSIKTSTHVYMFFGHRSPWIRQRMRSWNFLSCWCRSVGNHPFCARTRQCLPTSKCRLMKASDETSVLPNRWDWWVNHEIRPALIVPSLVSVSTQSVQTYVVLLQTLTRL